MGKVVLKNPKISLNSVDLSDHCSKVTIETKFDDVDVTSFGATFKQIAQGMGDGTMTFTFFQDFAAGSVDATLFPLWLAGTSFVVSVTPDKVAGVSATNPRYDMTGVLMSYNPLDGSVGDASTTDVTVSNTGTSGISRNTT
jgi:hypothetical protein